MPWVDILTAIATGAVGSGFVELIKRWAERTSTEKNAIDPSLVVQLVEDEMFCQLIGNLYAELCLFTEQLAIVYCELIGISGYSSDADEVADPRLGNAVFVPYAVELFWRNLYAHKLPREQLRGSDPLASNPDSLIRRMIRFQDSVDETSLRNTSALIHSHLKGILAHSKEAAAFFDSTAEVVYELCTRVRPNSPKHQARPALQDDTGIELRFYTIWQDSRYMATNQAIEILMRRSDGKLKIRLSKKDLIEAHLLLLSLFSVTGFLFETVTQIVAVLHRNQKSKLNDRLLHQYGQFTC